jgi:vancomycin resistance protein YoaR
MVLVRFLGVLLLVHQINAPNSLYITKDGQTFSIVNRTDYSNVNSGIPIINSTKYQQLLDKLNNQVSINPKNASLDQYGNIIPETIGTAIDRQTFTEQFYSYLFENHSTKLEIPMLQVYPKVDSEILADIRSKRIGRYITSFNTRNKKRSTNIQLATEAINNYVVFPGETFSFNRVVGKRTVEKGYLKAKVIVRGEYAEDIGGGICQVSSTLFNAVDSAGLQITQRFSHSRHVPYIPPGRDATVSWYGPDFEFKNKYNQPILIQAKTIGHLLVITLYSSEVIEYQPRKIPFPNIY